MYHISQCNGHYGGFCVMSHRQNNTKVNNQHRKCQLSWFIVKDSDVFTYNNTHRGIQLF